MNRLKEKSKKDQNGELEKMNKRNVKIENQDVSVVCPKCDTVIPLGWVVGR